MQRTPTSPSTEPQGTPPDRSVWSVFATGYVLLILFLAIFAAVLMWVVIK